MIWILQPVMYETHIKRNGRIFIFYYDFLSCIVKHGGINLAKYLFGIFIDLHIYENLLFYEIIVELKIK